MVLFDFLSKRITPLQHRAHLTWLYNGDNETTRVEVVYDTSPRTTTRAVCGGSLLEGLRL
jgi:hypothetical protein